MRHGDKVNNLGRKKAHREALLRNLAIELITHKRIVTTLAKAKALRGFVEPLITKTKKNTNEAQIMNQHRVVFSALNNKYAVKELFTVVAPKVVGRPGGYCRIIKLGIRPGDAAEMALIELVDFNEIYGKAAPAKAEPAKRTRRAGGAKKKIEAAVAETEATTATEVATEASAEVKADEASATEEKTAE